MLSRDQLPVSNERLIENDEDTGTGRKSLSGTIVTRIIPFNLALLGGEQDGLTLRLATKRK